MGKTMNTLIQLRQQQLSEKIQVTPVSSDDEADEDDRRTKSTLQKNNKDRDDDDDDIAFSDDLPTIAAITTIRDNDNENYDDPYTPLSPEEADEGQLAELFGTLGVSFLGEEERPEQTTPSPVWFDAGNEESSLVFLSDDDIAISEVIVEQRRRDGNTKRRRRRLNEDPAASSSSFRASSSNIVTNDDREDGGDAAEVRQRKRSRHGTPCLRRSSSHI